MAKRIIGSLAVWAMAAALAGALASCGGAGGDGAGGSDGTGKAGGARANETRVKPYDRDGMLGTTNSNPNLPTSPTYHTYGKDRELVEKTLARFPDAMNPRISFNGATLTVRYREPGEFTEEQSRKLREDLAAALRYQLPRYEIRVMGGR